MSQRSRPVQLGKKNRVATYRQHRRRPSTSGLRRVRKVERKSGCGAEAGGAEKTVKIDALKATRNERTLLVLLSKCRPQGAVAVQLPNFEVYCDCLDPSLQRLLSRPQMISQKGFRGPFLFTFFSHHHLEVCVSRVFQDPEVCYALF